MGKIKAAITGIHGYVPEYILTNKELEIIVDTTDEWIIERTGIKERRILKGEGLGTSFMAVKAAQGLLEKTNTDPKDINLVIMATTTPDMLFPATANLVSHGIGATNAFGFDLQAACSGFIYALTTGAQYIESGFAKKVLVLGGDKMSSILDYQDRTTCVIFGDGVGAVLLEPNEEGLGLQDAQLCSDGAGQEFLYMKAGGSRYPPTAETVNRREHFVTQHGAAVFKNAVQNMSEVAQRVMLRNNLTHEDIAYLVPHQANRRIIESTAGRLGLPLDKVLINIHRYGNTTSGTIPLCMWDHRHLFKKGDNLLLVAFGGGFTWGAIYLKWAIDHTN
ncbi:MAG: ketoacyl-ACP synthase III [Cytophagales bacterium]|nr:MAG: ketoacyl-ACP synthase III [Cytophagales bacterium]TAF61935.1 MAG: ketoacyl-ACP synthase III [Cytophagales bacterium]